MIDRKRLNECIALAAPRKGDAPSIAHGKAIVRLQSANATLNALREALQRARIAGNKRTADRIRLAISSAKGAVRVCEGQRTRTQRAHIASERGGK